MVQDTGLGAFPLVDGEGHEDENADEHGRQDSCISPGIQATSKASASEKERQSSSQKSTTYPINARYLAPEGQMIQFGVSPGGLVADKECDGCRSP
jgi:hypothetical protein